MSSKKDISHIESLREAKLDLAKKEIEITIIRTGTSQRRNYYSPKVLKEAAPLFAGIKMYMDHQDPDRASKEARSLKDWIGTVKESWYEGDDKQGAVKGKSAIRNEEFWDLVSRAATEGWLNEVGLSIDALAQARIGRDPAGQTAQIVESIIQPRSVDAVTEASAGGSIDNLKESAIAEEVLFMEGLDKLTLDELLEARPDLIQTIQEGAVAEVQDELDEATEAEVEELEGQGFYLDRESGVLYSPEDLEEIEQTLGDMGYAVTDDGEVVSLEDDEVDDEADNEVEDGDEEIVATIDPDKLRLEGYEAAVRDMEIQNAQESMVSRPNVEVANMGRQLKQLNEKVAQVTESHVELATTAIATKMLRESGLPEVTKSKLLPYMVGRSEEEMTALIQEECAYLEKIAPTVIRNPHIQEASIESDRVTAQARLDLLVTGQTDIKKVN